MSYNKLSKIKSLIFLSIIIFIGISSSAQESNSALDTDALKKQDLKIPAEKSLPEKKPASVILLTKVLEVYTQKYKDSANKRHNMASIGDIIVVRVENMDSLIKLSQCKDAGTGCTPQKICLFINGRLINNIYPISGAPQKIGNTNIWELQYQLERNQDNDKIWATILGAPSFFTNHFFVEPVTISIGLQNGYAIETNANFNDNNFQLERIHRGWFWACFAAVILYIMSLFVLVKRSGFLRDRNIDLSSINISPSANPPYSLARFQMAFWFTLFIISFLFIWLITDAYDIITPTVLALIGISAGTSLSALVIDNNKKQELLKKTQELQLSLLTPELTATKINQTKSEISSNIRELTTTSKSFFTDLLEDANGISFHRLQMLVWTFVLGLIFIYCVWKRLSMPDFDATLLALQGLTSGTYLGFKFPEKQS